MLNLPLKLVLALRAFIIHHTHSRSDHQSLLHISAETKLQNSPFTFGKMFNTFGVVPKDHEGYLFMIGLSGEFDQDILLTEEIAVDIKASGEGIFRIGNHAEAVAGKTIS